MARTPIHPGEILGDELEEIGLSAKKLAEVIRCCCLKLARSSSNAASREPATSTGGPPRSVRKVLAVLVVRGNRFRRGFACDQARESAIRCKARPDRWHG
jgi:hypothetical protein